MPDAAPNQPSAWPSAAMMLMRAIMACTVVVVGVALLFGFQKIFDVVAACVLASTWFVYRATRVSPTL